MMTDMKSKLNEDNNTATLRRVDFRDTSYTDIFHP